MFDHNIGLLLLHRYRCYSRRAHSFLRLTYIQVLKNKFIERFIVLHLKDTFIKHYDGLTGKLCFEIKKGIVTSLWYSFE